ERDRLVLDQDAAALDVLLDERGRVLERRDPGAEVLGGLKDLAGAEVSSKPPTGWGPSSPPGPSARMDRD
ncbi:MAG: hypothetical protein ACXWMU_02565, partial [Candidatus Limnocylindrales bacterium]